MPRPRSESAGPAAAARRRRRRALIYDDLPKEIKGIIKDYAAFTNASLRAAVKEYFEDKAACERRHGKIGTWNVKYVTDMSMLFSGRHFIDPGINAWDTSSVTTMRSMFSSCRAFHCRIGSWDTFYAASKILDARRGSHFELRAHLIRRNAGRQ